MMERGELSVTNVHNPNDLAILYQKLQSGNPVVTQDLETGRDGIGEARASNPNRFKAQADDCMQPGIESRF
jgi:hypothetical protein